MGTRSVAKGIARLRLWAGAVLVLDLALVGLGAARYGVAPSAELALLAATVVAAEHRDRLFGDETSISGSIVVAMASIVAFSGDGWLAAPMICASAAGLYWPHLQARAWSRVGVNAASMGLAAGLAAVVFHAIRPGEVALDVSFLLAGVAALCAFWIVNSTILGVAVSLIQGRSWLRVSAGLVSSDVILLPFAFGGLFCGYLAEQRLIVGWVTLVLLVGAVDVFAIRRLRPRLPFSGLLSVVVITTSVGIVIATSVPFRVVGYALPVGALLAVVSLVLLDAVKSALRLAAYLTCVVGVAVVYHSGDAQFFAPALVGVVSALAALASARRTPWSCPAVAATTLSALFVACVGALVPADWTAGFAGCLGFGLLATLGGLAGWYAPLAASLMSEFRRQALAALRDLVMIDAWVFALVGVSGAVCGWLGRSHGVGAFAATLVAVLAAFSLVAWHWRSHDPRFRLDDDQVLDMVRSAVLDLPGSQFPSDTYERSASHDRMSP
jgi:hypothetical protein